MKPKLKQYKVKLKRYLHLMTVKDFAIIKKFVTPIEKEKFLHN